MPPKVQKSFSDEQLTHVKAAIGARSWGKHAIDCRGVIKFFKYRYYFVVLAGRNRRELSERETKIAVISQAVTMSILSFCMISLLLLFVYLVKSALGIDLFNNHSFGVWAWFKGLFK